MEVDEVMMIAIAALVLSVLSLAIVIVSRCLKCLRAPKPAVSAHHIYEIQTRLASLETVDPSCTRVPIEDGPSQTPTGTLLREKEKLPRYSVVCNGKSVDVFADVRMSQIYCIAQDYFSSKDNKVDVEDMEVHAISRRRKHLTDKQRPRSILNQSNQSRCERDNRCSFPGMFLAKTIGPEGGSISINGAKLTIPAGALRVSMQIQLGVVWKSGGTPTLKERQALLSSVVTCEPHGQEFDTPVNLEVQHCAQNYKEWRLITLTSDTSVREAPDWQELASDEFDPIYGQSSIGLRLKHFSQYAVLGEAVSNKATRKVVKLVPFVPPVKLGDPLMIRVYCVDDYDSNSVDRQETRRLEGSEQAHPPQPLCISDCGSNVRVRVAELSDGWEVQGASRDARSRLQEDLEFYTVWQGARPVASFLIKPPSDDKKAEEIMCTLEGFQVGQEERKQVDEIRKTLTNNVNPAAHKTEFPLSLRNELIKRLEPEDRLEGRDWKQVADFLKRPRYDVVWLEDQKGTRFGPMELLLRQWEHENRSLDQFKDLMKQMKRLDVVNSIESYQALTGVGQETNLKNRIRRTLKLPRKGPKIPKRPFGTVAGRQPTRAAVFYDRQRSNTVETSTPNEDGGHRVRFNTTIPAGTRTADRDDVRVTVES